MNNKIIVLDSRISVNAVNKLLNMGYGIIKIPENPMFDRAVSAHPDMFLTKIDDILFVDNTVKEMFTFSEKIRTVDREAKCFENCFKYPYDIEFNCVQVGKNLICNEKHTNNKILDFAKSKNINIINVNQGYAKCSVCVVSDNALITEDDGIALKAINNGIDILKVTKGFVKMYGYDYGFIGGCCGLIEKDLLVFNGKIENHPEYVKIKNFCKKYGVNVMSLSNEDLYDTGTVYRI